MPIRALFVHRDLRYHGGIPNSFLNLARCLDRMEIVPEIASFQEPDPQFAEKFADEGVPVHCLGDDGYLSPTVRLSRIAAERRFDVLVPRSFKAYLVCKAVGFSRSARTVFWMPGVRYVISGSVRKILFQILSRNDTLIYISHAVRRAHSNRLHRGAEYVVHHGLRPPSEEEGTLPYSATMRSELGIPLSARVVGYTAAFNELKNHRVLLEAFSTLAADREDLHLVLVGEGRLRQAMEQWVLDHCDPRRVHFTGTRRDARALLGVMDVYVHPAYDEGFGWSLLEAMVAGVPVVAAKSGALPELVDDERTGLLFDPMLPQDLTERLERLLDDEVLRLRLGTEAAVVSAIRFSPERFATGISEALLKTVSKK